MWLWKYCCCQSFILPFLFFYTPLPVTSILKSCSSSVPYLSLNRGGVCFCCMTKDRPGSWPEGTESYYSSIVLLFWPWAPILNWTDCVNVQLNGTCLSDVWNAYCRLEKTPQPTAPVLKAVSRWCFVRTLPLAEDKHVDEEPGHDTGVDDQIDYITRGKGQSDNCKFPACCEKRKGFLQAQIKRMWKTGLAWD